MSQVSQLLPPRPSDLGFLPALAWDRRISILEGGSHDGFVDRLQWSAEMILDLYSWRTVGAISRDQQVAMLRELRRCLQADLGAITSDDGTFAANEVPA